MKQKSKHEHRSVEEFLHARDSAFARFPLLFTLLGAFGVSATFYGIGKIIETIPLLADNPLISLAVGLLILVFTGKLYKKLG